MSERFVVVNDWFDPNAEPFVQNSFLTFELALAALLGSDGHILCYENNNPTWETKFIVRNGEVAGTKKRKTSKS